MKSWIEASCVALVICALAIAQNQPHTEQGHNLGPPGARKIISGAEHARQWGVVEDLAEEYEASEYGPVPVLLEPTLGDGSWLVRLRDFSGESGAGVAGVVDHSDPRIPAGAYLNTSGLPVTIEYAGVDGAWSGTSIYEPGAILYFADQWMSRDGDEVNSAGVTVSVTCRDGFFACCNAGPPPTARCVANSNQHQTCTAGGGPGSVSCTVGSTN